ncbi:MAG: hypothetical protein ACOX63_10115 [Christensenellales bacterium]
MTAVNRTENGKRERDAKGRFVKGNKGGGRPKQPPEFKALVKENATVALETVIEIMKNPEEDTKDRLTAARLVIEYAYGKAPQAIKADITQQMAGDFVLEIAGSGQDGTD